MGGRGIVGVVLLLVLSGWVWSYFSCEEKWVGVVFLCREGRVGTHVQEWWVWSYFSCGEGKVGGCGLLVWGWSHLMYLSFPSSGRKLVLLVSPKETDDLQFVSV